MTVSGRTRVAYRELADELRSAILNQGIADGGRLPTEFELANRYQVSRQTVRRAYLELVAEGLVQRTPGRGSFAAPSGRYVRSMGSLEDLLAQSVDTEMEIVQPLHRVSAPVTEIVERLGSEELMEVRIRRLHQNVPFSVAVVSTPGSIGDQLAGERLLTQSGAKRRITVLEILDRILDPPIVAAKQVIKVDRAPDDIAPLIDLKRRQPVLRIDRLFVDGHGRPVELAVNYFNPDRYSYHLELKRSAVPKRSASADSRTSPG